MLPTKTNLQLVLHLHPLESPPQVQELYQYPLLLPGSAFRFDDSLAEYLAEGGFAILDRREFQSLRRLLEHRFGERVKAITVTVEHPIFHSFYDITEYVCVTRRRSWCPSILPLDGIEVDGSAGSRVALYEL